MKQVFLLSIFLAFVMASCTNKGPGVHKDDEISSEIKTEIKALNDKVFKSIRDNDATIIKEIGSAQLLEKAATDIELLISRMNPLILNKSYTILNEYYIISNEEDTVVNVKSGDTGVNEYDFSCEKFSNESYVSLFTTDDIDNNLLILCVYGKVDKEWKLNVLHFGQYKLGGKTAPEHYEIANNCYEKDFLIDAANTMAIANLCSRPSDKFYLYNSDKEMSDFFEKAVKEANQKYVLPMIIEEVDSKPSVFNISPQSFKEGIFPMVNYVSKISFSDTVALAEENEKLQSVIGNTFNGIEKDKDFIFFRAYEEIPDGSKEVEQYGFVKRLR